MKVPVAKVVTSLKKNTHTNKYILLHAHTIKFENNKKIRKKQNKLSVEN